MRSRSLLAVGVAVVSLGVGAAPRSQDAGDQTRHIVAEEFLKARPGAAKPSTAAKPTYAPADAKSKAKAAGATLDLGMTLWRLRPSAPSEDAARLLVQDATSSELTAERIDTGTTLTIGDRVRLTLESPGAGFLYVIDREIYSDGKMSEPYSDFSDDANAQRRQRRARRQTDRHPGSEGSAELLYGAAQSSRSDWRAGSRSS